MTTDTIERIITRIETLNREDDFYLSEFFKFLVLLAEIRNESLFLQKLKELQKECWELNGQKLGLYAFVYYANFQKNKTDRGFLKIIDLYYSIEIELFIIYFSLVADLEVDFFSGAKKRDLEKAI